MGIVERREREREEIRNKILDAARELFATEGYEKVTMRRIADAIEYSPTTIYLHFKDKDDLVQSMCHEDFARLLGALQSGPLPDDPVERIRQLGVAYARFGLTYPNHYRFMFMTPGKFTSLHELSDGGQQSFKMLHLAVAGAVACGTFRAVDVDTAAQVMWAALHGVVALLITLQPEHWPHAPAVDDLVEQVIENGIRGFVAPEPARAAAGRRSKR
jgi:AcrR family transcriptional regulator